jgi:predicted dienelactone hydrolase
LAQLKLLPGHWQRSTLAALTVVLSFAATSRAQESVKVTRADGAETPLRVYRPANNPAQACAPLALISPGAGGTENGYSYLAEGLRDHGFLAIVLGHKESGPGKLVGEVTSSGLHGGLTDMVTDPALHRDRGMDLTAAFDWAEKQCKRPFTVLLGHSMGSDTVMFEAGAENKLGIHGQDRFNAYVALSPSGPGSIFPEHAWSKIHKPLYVLTGTEDKGLEGPWQWRARPYDDLPPGCKWLGIIDGATHMNFAGVGFARKTKKLTLDTVLEFLDKSRNENCSAPTPPDGMQLKGK